MTVPPPWVEIPETAGMEPLFSELDPAAVRMVEIAATRPGEGLSRQTVMTVAAPEAEAAERFAMVFMHVREIPGYEITVRAFDGD